MIKLLVVEADEKLNLAVCKHLSYHNYYAKGVSDGAAALNLLYTAKYDMIISDIMMPNMDGFEFAKTIRQLDQNIPILFVTARSDFASKERGFRTGIDDYMTKPVDLDELLLRIAALLRRSKIASDKRIVVGNLTLDQDAMTATVDDEIVELTLREFRILYKLLSYPNKIFTRGQLLDEFSGYESEAGLRSVDVHITNLRQKLSNCNGFKINTVRGLVYKAVQI